MKKELTIEHLAAYLPYRLMIIDANETVSEMVELSTNNEPIVVHCDTYGIGRYKLNSHAKPLLRPLPQLTETIEHGGERFVPVDRLAKLAGYEKATWSYWAGRKGSSAGQHYSLEFDTDKGFYVDVLDNHYTRDHSFSFEEPCNNQMLLLKTLHSLHFDTFGLIEAGLAEPIPSIPQP